MINFRIGTYNVEFELTCTARPEQYDVFLEGAQIGYVRLRWGSLTASYPDVGGRAVYFHTWDDGWSWKGCFDTDEEREEHLEKIAHELLKEWKKREAEAQG